MELAKELYNVLELKVRRIIYNGYPNALLPDALKNENPLGIYRLVNGGMTRTCI